MAPTLGLAGLALLAQGAEAGLLPQANMVDAIFHPMRKHFLYRLGETDETMERWIVGLKQTHLTEQLDSMLAVPNVQLLFKDTNTALTYRGTHSQVEALVRAHSDAVKYYEPDAEVTAIPIMVNEDVTIAANTDDTPWGVARVGARDQTFTGKGVHIYVFDTGVRTTHEEFGGRAIPTFENNGRDVICDQSNAPGCANDQQGHGTHCAATAAGTKWGVASGATVRAVKILSNSGSGSLSWSVSAMNWLARQNLEHKAVASMSIGSKGTYRADEDGVNALTNKGIVVSVAAGNSAGDACGESPAFVPSAMTVGANDESDAMASFSNYGRCIDIFAPGTNTYSASPDSDTAGKTLSGTSMACPHVSGAVAIKMEEFDTEDPPLDRNGFEKAVLSRSDSEALQGDTLNSLTTILRVGGSYNRECDDVSSFKDSWGFSCVWWWPFSCTFTFILSYSDAELVDVRNQCKNSCGICQT